MIEGDFCKVLLKWETVIERGYWAIAFLVKFWCLHQHNGGMTPMKWIPLSAEILVFNWTCFFSKMQHWNNPVTKHQQFRCILSILRRITVRSAFRVNKEKAKPLHNHTWLVHSKGVLQARRLHSVQRGHSQQYLLDVADWLESLYQTPTPLLFQNFWIRVWIQVRQFFKFENPTFVQTLATIIDPTVIYPCFYLKNYHTDSCHCQKWKVTLVPGPVFPKFYTPGPNPGPDPKEKCRILPESTPDPVPPLAIMGRWATHCKHRLKLIISWISFHKMYSNLVLWFTFLWWNLIKKEKPYMKSSI